MDAAALFLLLRFIAGGALMALAAALMLGAAIGALRFPDVYTRLHAANVGDGLGAVLFVLALAVMAPNVAVGLKLVLLAALVGALAPLLTHFTGAGAHAGGLTPIAGRYAAPRPGKARETDHA